MTMDGLQYQPSWRSPFSNFSLHETRSFTWELISLPSDPPGFLKFHRFQFEAGHSIGHPSKWSLFILSCSSETTGESKSTTATRRPKEGIDDADFLGLFLDKIILDPESEDLEDDQLQSMRRSLEFVTRCNVEVLSRDGVVVLNRNVETVPRFEVSEGYWGWRKVSPILQTCTQTPDTSTPTCSLQLRITFTILGRRIDNVTKIPSSQLDLLAKEKEFEREIAMSFYKLALSSNTDPDFVIQTDGGKQYSVHKDILSARSPVFSRMFETSMVESALGKASIFDISPETLSCILRHVYTGQVELDWLSRPKLASELVYASGKYWLSSLRNFCDKFLVRAATRKNCMRLLELASLHDLDIATEDLTRFVHDKMTRSRSTSRDSRDSKNSSGDEL